jgi:hypothetical protein
VSIFYQFKIQEGMINLKQNGRSKKHLQIGQDFSDYGDSGDRNCRSMAGTEIATFIQDRDASSTIVYRDAMPIRQMARRSTNDDSLNHNE